jgi:hypothetical protein
MCSQVEEEEFLQARILPSLLTPDWSFFWQDALKQNLTVEKNA